MIIDLMSEDFNEEIKNNLTLVDFYAVWCGPCKMMHPVIEEIANNYSNLKIIKVDVDKHQELARNYSVMSIPTLILFKDGQIVEKNIGFTPSVTLESWIKSHE